MSNKFRIGDKVRIVNLSPDLDKKTGKIIGQAGWRAICIVWELPPTPEKFQKDTLWAVSINETKQIESIPGEYLELIEDK